MKYVVQSTCWFVVAALLMLTLRPAGAQPPADWDTLLATVESRAAELDRLIAAAQDKGLATDRAQVSRTTMSMFVTAAKHDRANPEHIELLFSKFERPEQVAPDAVERLPFDQLNGCIAVADFAINQLKLQLSGELTLEPSPDLMRPGMTLNDRGQYEFNGRPVFPTSLIWIEDSLEARRAFGALGGTFSQLEQTVSRGGATLPPDILRGHAQRIARHAKQNLSPLVFHLGHSPAAWMKEQYPEILGGGRHFVQYDIDNPRVRAWITSLSRQLLPAISEAAGDTPVMHLLANEPHFSIAKPGWKSNNQLSEITLNKFKRWLADKYGSIKTLNRYYGTHYASFDDVDTTNPISREIRGSAAWYDWCRFNMDRVNEWFTFLKETLQAHDDAAHPVTIKLIGHALEDLKAAHGIDIEYLTQLQDVNGADLRVTPYDAVFHGRHEQGLDPKTAWTSRYKTEWLSQSIFLDFTKSLRPETAFYDSEWHGLSTVAWRDFSLDRDYVRSALWLAYSHGMSLTNAWVWGRDVNGRHRTSYNFYGELSTQPIATDAYGRVIKELNAHAQQVVASVPQARRFMVYFTQESAIQSATYTEHMCHIYEALKLRNYHVGFTTPTEIQKLNPAEHIVVAPPAEFIADASLKRLQDFSDAGGRVVVIDDRGNYAKTELAQKREGSGGIKGFLTIPVGGVVELTDAFREHLDPFKIETPLDFSYVADTGDEMYGVFVQQFTDSQTGDIYVLVNSMAKDSGVISFKRQGASDLKFIDVLTQREFGSSLPIDPWAVYLLRTSP